MAQNVEIEYMKCLTCGKFIITEDAYKKMYCSLACSSIYEKCKTCGSYYAVKKGYSEQYCSSECAEASAL